MDGSNNIYYAMIYNSSSNTFSMISEPVSFDFTADNIIVGDYKYIISQNELMKLNMENFCSGTSYTITTIDLNFVTRINWNFYNYNILSFKNNFFFTGIEEGFVYLYSYNPETNIINKCSDFVFNKSYEKIIFFNKV